MSAGHFPGALPQAAGGAAAAAACVHRVVELASAPRADAPEGDDTAPATRTATPAGRVLLVLHRRTSASEVRSPLRRYYDDDDNNNNNNNNNNNIGQK